MVAKRQTLDGWIQEAMTDDEKGRIAAIILVHFANGEREVDAVRFTGAKAWKASELALRFKSKAESYCQDMPGSQTFQLLAYYYDSNDAPRTDPEARHPFSLMGADGVDHGPITDAPTDKGVIQQTMRHLEVMYQETVRMSRAMFDRSVDLNNQMMLQQQATQKELNESYKVMRDMYLQARGEEHRMQLEQTKAERESVLIEALLRYAPALLNTISGKEVFPQSTADSALIEGIVKNLKPEHIDALASIVPPESFGLLMARFEQSVDKRITAEQSAMKAVRQIPGEQDAIGELTK
jgi:hypothetical protein